MWRLWYVRSSFSLAGFLLFEMCVGLYFPACGTLKSALVPDFARAAIYNLFRVPLNLIVLVVLLGERAPFAASLS